MIVDRVEHSKYVDLEKTYPIENKVLLKNLKKLLGNLVVWCPFFEIVDYMPLLVFPFVKVFRNEPITCFEAVCTIISKIIILIIYIYIFIYLFIYLFIYCI